MKKLKQYCQQHHYPIMADESLDYIKSFIKDGDKVLELGSCVGYSSIYLAMDKDIKIISLERDFQRHLLAKEHVKSYQKEDSISMVYDDAMVYEPVSNFDVIIFDAAKAQNQIFFERYFKVLKEDGILFIDNMDFHGHVQAVDKIKNRNLKRMVQMIGDFDKEITKRQDLKVTHLPLGDGLLMITRFKT